MPMLRQYLHLNSSLLIHAFDFIYFHRSITTHYIGKYTYRFLFTFILTHCRHFIFMCFCFVCLNILFTLHDFLFYSLLNESYDLYAVVFLHWSYIDLYYFDNYSNSMRFSVHNSITHSHMSGWTIIAVPVVSDWKFQFVI